jgi:hypothetical protein
MQQIPSTTVVQAPRSMPLTPRFAHVYSDFGIPATKLSPQKYGLHVVDASKSCLPELRPRVTDADPRLKFFSDNFDHCHCSRPHQVLTFISVAADCWA